MRNFLKIFLVLFAFKVAIWIVGWFSWLFLPWSGKGWLGIYTHHLFLQLWTRWDGGWFLKIAKEGYSWPSYAFFPLYPLLIRAIAKVVKDPVLAGFLISNFSSFIAGFYLFKLTEFVHDKRTAFLTILYFCSYPCAFYMTCIYSEALFLAFLGGQAL